MDFAANAVFDLAAPQPRAVAARPAPADASVPSFDDHLDAVTAEAPQREDNAKASEPQKSESAESKESGDAAVDATLIAPPAAPPPIEAPAPAHIVQIVAPQTAPASDAAPGVSPTTETAPTTPAAASPLQPAKAEQAVQEAPAQPGADATKAAPTQKSAPVESAAPTETSVEAAPDAVPQASAPQANAPIVPPAPTVTAMPISTEAAEAIATIAPPTASAPSIAREAATRVAKADARIGGKAVHASDVDAPPPLPVIQRGAAKSAPTLQSGPENIANAAPALDAPEAPAPTPQAQTLSSATTTQTQTTALEQANAARAAPAAAQVAREIVRRFDGENTRFELRLDPPELGRVEVRLDVSRDHRVTAVIAADSPQALSELARHARDLEQMLQSSGLELSDSGLSFDLRQGGEGTADAESATPDAHAIAANDEALQQQSSTARPLGYERWRGVRVDMMV